jgi:hypothetical protein
MPAPARKTHYFILNAQALSATRKGPFDSREAALEWAQKNFAHYPYWLLPVEAVGDRRGLDANGEPIREG